MSEIVQFYESNTNRSAKQAPNRIANIENFLKGNNLTLNDVKLICNKDPYWNIRRNRTELEKKAILIGYTNTTMKAYPLEEWWLVPLK